MKRLLNTLYVLTDDLYLALDGENVVAKRRGEEVGRIPIHTLQAIYCFSYAGASPALMGKCAENGIELAFFKPSSGRFLADVGGMQQGNVLLRQIQFDAVRDDVRRVSIARNLIVGKVFNSKWVLERCLRDHGMRIDAERVRAASQHLSASIDALRSANSVERIMGIEGDAAATYYSVFNEMILSRSEAFSFKGRNRRPPLDPVNAMLSLFYTVLSLDCASALRGVGFDPYVGFLHADRPGRRSLALDLMEELRSIVVDRFVISAVNNRLVSPGDFDFRESGETLLNDGGRKRLFESWQKRKKEQIMHPFLGERIPWGLVPYIQSQLMAKYLREELDGYPPFLWK